MFTAFLLVFCNANKVSRGWTFSGDSVALPCVEITWAVRDCRMLEIYKTLHFISLWIAGGIGVGGWVIQHMHAKNNARPGLEVVRSLRLLGLLALFAVIVLWVTGYLMAHLIYGGIPALGAFHVKLVAATAVLLGSIGANLETLRSIRLQVPPRTGIMHAVAWMVRIALLVVLSATAIAFS